MARTRRLRLLVTAGPTREYIDPVRYISNDSSGAMGFAIAEAACAAGWAVTLVHGPVALKAPAGVRGVPVVSANDMLEACEKFWPRQDALVMAAAVADYTPARRAARKRKKSDAALELKLRPTVDILARLSKSRRAGQVVVGFALEDRAGRQNARDKLERKQLDAVLLNRPAAIGAKRSALDLLERGEKWQAWRSDTKTRHAERIVSLLARLHERHASR